MGEKAHLLGPDHALPKLPPIDSKTHSQHHRLSDVASNHSSSIAQAAFPLKPCWDPPFTRRHLPVSCLGLLLLALLLLYSPARPPSSTS